MATMPSSLPPSDAEPLQWLWRPSGSAEPTVADKDLNFDIEAEIKYLGFIIGAEVRHLLRHHHTARLGGARAVRDKARANAHQLSALTFGARLWAWTLLGDH